ncbi:DUF6297 family protein [uncultured Pseudokineococcus sp.]|uniref:DUF6297 family protein n=1 Tax=uncultured Pseudokineococcus sp. TaxID=1642928 RepID=UPI002623A618|nr:DUF6297 family protein [uncultured Pseudokineococcus sp.]
MTASTAGRETPPRDDGDGGHPEGEGHHGDEGADVPGHVLRPVADGPGTSAAQLRATVRRASRRAGGASLGDLLGDVYAGVFAVALSLLVLSGSRGRVGELGGVTSLGAPVSGPGLPAEVLAAAALLLVVGGVVGLLARLGPLSLAPPRAVWWLPLPVDRGPLLRPVLLLRAVGVALAVGAGAFAGLLLVLPGSTGVGALLGAAGAAANVAVAGVAVGGLLQVARGTAGPLVRAADVLVLLAPLLVVAAAVVDAAQGGAGAGPASPAAVGGGGGTPAAPGAAGATAVVAAVVVAVLARRAGRAPAASLASAGALSAHVAGSGALLDTRALGRVLSEPPGAVRARSRRRSSRWTRRALVRGPRSALVVADLLGVLRTPRRTVTALVLALVPAGAASAAGESRAAVLLVLLACGYGAATTLAEPVRVRVLAPALDGVLPVSPGAVAGAHLGALVLLGTGVSAVTAAALWLLAPGALPLGLVVATGPGLAAAALRGAARPEVDPGAGLVMTSAGPVPLGLVASLVRGPDLAVVAVLPLAVGTLALVGGGRLLPDAELVLVAVALLLAAGLGAVAAAGSRPPQPEAPDAVAASGPTSPAVRT